MCPSNLSFATASFLPGFSFGLARTAVACTASTAKLGCRAASPPRRVSSACRGWVTAQVGSLALKRAKRRTEVFSPRWPARPALWLPSFFYAADDAGQGVGSEVVGAWGLKGEGNIRKLDIAAAGDLNHYRGGSYSGRGGASVERKVGRSGDLKPICDPGDITIDEGNVVGVGSSGSRIEITGVFREDPAVGQHHIDGCGKIRFGSAALQDKGPWASNLIGAGCCSLRRISVQHASEFFFGPVLGQCVQTNGKYQDGSYARCPFRRFGFHGKPPTRV